MLVLLLRLICRHRSCSLAPVSVMGSGILLLTRVGVVKGKAVAIPLPLCCCAEPLEVTSAGAMQPLQLPSKNGMHGGRSFQLQS